jgi:hypothetical protein
MRPGLAVWSESQIHAEDPLPFCVDEPGRFQEEPLEKLCVGDALRAVRVPCVAIDAEQLDVARIPDCAPSQLAQTKDRPGGLEAGNGAWLPVAANYLLPGDGHCGPDYHLREIGEAV